MNEKIKLGNPMKPLSPRVVKYNVGGFDIETYGHTNKFYMGSVVHRTTGHNRDYKEGHIVIKVFYNKKDMIEYMIQEKFARRFVWVATNLQFDLLGLFGETKYFNNLRFLMRDSRFLMARYLIGDNKNKRSGIKFFDTLNHLRASVQDLGDILKVPKLEKPSFLGKKPVDAAEVKILEEYNIRDSTITFQFMEFIQDNYNKIGTELRCTLPSTSMNLYRRKYLKEHIFQPEREKIDYLFKGYYGGRCETIKRGRIKNLNLYDINSLYPCAMSLYDYPYPNVAYFKKYTSVDMHQINKYEGVADVELYCPENIWLPYLPVRHNGKLVFPTGLIKGYYTFFEIREAVKRGYDVLKIHSSLAYTKTHTPFKDFVTDMYNGRMRHKIDKSNMEIVYKILMNSLYGKFAQRITADPDIRHIDSFTSEEFMGLWNNPNINMDVVNNYVYIKKPINRVPCYVNPIYSIYVTAYARHILYNLLPKDVYYMDTDSCMTKEKLDTGIMLGEWKHEDVIKDGYIVKPKFYLRNDTAKIKGLGRLTKNDFQEILLTRNHDYEKVVKFKEAIRRKKKFNEVIDMTKHMSLEDNKRLWEKPFAPQELQISKPLILERHHYDSK